MDDPYNKDDKGPGEDGPGNTGSGDSEGEPGAVNTLFADLSKKEDIPFLG